MQHGKINIIQTRECSSIRDHSSVHPVGSAIEDKTFDSIYVSSFEKILTIIVDIGLYINFAPGPVYKVKSTSALTSIACQFVVLFANNSTIMSFYDQSATNEWFARWEDTSTQSRDDSNYGASSATARGFNGHPRETSVIVRNADSSKTSRSSSIREMSVKRNETSEIVKIVNIYNDVFDRNDEFNAIEVVNLTGDDTSMKDQTTVDETSSNSSSSLNSKPLSRENNNSKNNPILVVEATEDDFSTSSLVSPVREYNDDRSSNRH